MKAIYQTNRQRWPRPWLPRDTSTPGSASTKARRSATRAIRPTRRGSNISRDGGNRSSNCAAPKEGTGSPSPRNSARFLTCRSPGLPPSPSATLPEPEPLPAPGTRAHDLLGRLPAELHDVVRAVYLDGLTTAEAAVLLDIPQGTVKSRLARARSLLQEDLR